MMMATAKTSRVWAMPSADTFSIEPIHRFVHRWLEGCKVIVDPFARNNLLATHRNDLSPDTRAEWHMDAAGFCEMLLADGLVADAVIFDPPYSPRQISEVYRSIGREVTIEDTQNAALYSRVRRPLRSLLRSGGIALSFGWNSTGIGDWPIAELMLVYHGGAHNDTICVAQRKPDELF